MSSEAQPPFQALVHCSLLIWFPACAVDLHVLSVHVHMIPFFRLVVLQVLFGTVLQ
jgi:hypothetical protein